MPSSSTKFLEKKLKINFKEKNLLEQALCHASYARPHKGLDNERLEFLGDAVISLIISEELYRQNPLLREGKLTEMRSKLVRGDSLSKAAQRLGLQDYLRHKLDVKAGRTLDNLLEQAFEALIGAVFLDQGFPAAKEKILEWLPLDSADAGGFNPKGALQELLQPKIPLEEIVYALKGASGPHHDRIFTVELWVKGRVISTASAGSKKAAEEKAAETALKKLKT